MKILEEDPPLADEASLPWPIDVALYPFSAAGMVHLGIFCLGPPLLGLINRLILSRIPFGTLIAFALFFCSLHTRSTISLIARLTAPKAANGHRRLWIRTPPTNRTSFRISF